MNIAVLQTARAGSQSVIKKNTLVINNKPLFLHNIIHVKKSKYNLPIFLSTDIKGLENYSKQYNFKLIDRPDHLAGNDASHHEVITHGIIEIENFLRCKLDYIVVLLGNTIAAWHSDIDRAIDIISDNGRDVDSVVTVGKYNMFNPMRSMTKDSSGCLERLIQHEDFSNSNKVVNTSDKDILGDVYYMNGSIMVMKRSAVFSKSNKLPFPWLGDKVVPIEQDPICMELDAQWQTSIIQLISDDNSIAR